MKYYCRYNLYMAMVSLLLLVSCNQWLDVSPKNEFKEDDQFASQKGFEDALVGIYQQAGSTSLYGENLSYGMLNVLAQLYENKSTENEVYGRMARYSYSLFQTITDQIWNQMYKAIAQSNYTLENVKKNPSVLTTARHDLIKGECMGIRGFMHFELLRLFAPSYRTGETVDLKVIPYMDAFKIEAKEKATVQEVLDACEKDLKAAETLLAADTHIDQIANNSSVSDAFLMFRQNRFNLWAVKATLARLYLFQDKKEKALDYALEVINGAQFSFMPVAKLNNNPNLSSTDLTFSMEHIFSIYVPKLKNQSDLLFKSLSTTGGDPNDYFSTKANLDVIYESTATNPGYANDIRRHDAALSLWRNVVAKAYYTMKFDVSGDNITQSRVPVIRLPEMYYIAAESSADVKTAVGYLNVVRNARQLPKLAETISSTQLQTEIFKEYRKEFYAEGQLWYYYKRKNYVSIPQTIYVKPMTDREYIFPLPQAETYNGK